MIEVLIRFSTKSISSNYYNYIRVNLSLKYFKYRGYSIYIISKSSYYIYYFLEYIRASYNNT